jgi:predicted ester cyclase
MPVEGNASVVLRSYEAVNRQDLETALGAYAPDAINHAAPGAPRGREGLQRVLTGLFTLFPDFHQELEDVVAVDDKVVLRMTFSGTHRGEIPPPPGTPDGSIPSRLGGVPPSGKSFSVPVIYIHRMANGQIMERWAVRDDLAMLQQLGVIPVSKPEV